MSDMSGACLEELIKVMPFSKCLEKLLILAGRYEGRDKWAESNNVGKRTLSRWLNEDTRPSAEKWERFLAAITDEHHDNVAVMDQLSNLNQLRQDLFSNAIPKDDSFEQHAARKPSPTQGQLIPVSDRHWYSRFLADTSIAAQLNTSTGSRSVYLDEVYVHRNRVEKAAIVAATRYLASTEVYRGGWLSIVGGAGHGKTSLLWRIAQDIYRLCPQVFPVQALQLSLSSLADFEQSIPETAGPFFVILDTLDLLTGADDSQLASHLNRIRARGGFLITTCRRQELQLLAQHIRSDQVIELGRYEPDEARLAIQSYVKSAYRSWSTRKREAQIEHVWELLDERRRIQDLSFEPLLLRMIFEAYVPDDIPSDINTQKVYDHFWEERVLNDRRTKAPDVAYARSFMSRILASYLYFHTQTHTERASVDAFLKHCKSEGLEKPLTAIEGLTSSGVVRYWQMGSACGFFHQTFLEYVAAKDLLALGDTELQRERIEKLLSDAREANLFRIPVLKQLMIQASLHETSLFDRLCMDVIEIGNPIAVRLVLEVLGKAHNIAKLQDRVLDWGTKERELFQATASEVLRYFPATRTELALRVLAPHVNDKTMGEICYICTTYFAPMEPKTTLKFLVQLWRDHGRALGEHEGNLKTALVAVFQSGEAAALDVLAEMLPSFTLGVQAGVLIDLSEAWTEVMAPAARMFLEQIFGFLSVSESNEPRGAYVKAFRALHAVDPSQTLTLMQAIRPQAAQLSNVRIATFVGRLIGIADPSPSAIKGALRDIRGKDHVRRLYAIDLLREAARSNNSVIDDLLTLPVGAAMPPELLNAIYNVASGSEDPKRMLSVMDRWPMVEHGGGGAYRVLVEKIVQTDPKQILSWLKKRIPTAKSDVRQRQVLVGFQILAENAVTSMTTEDARQFFRWGFLRDGITGEMKRVFSRAAGWIAEIDMKLAREIFQAIYKSHRRECVNAAITSLRAVSSIELITYAFDLTVEFTEEQKYSASFGHFLEICADRSPEIRAALLQRLATPKLKTLIAALDSPGITSHVLVLLKSTVGADLAAVLDLIQICPILDEGNAAALSAVLDNASYQTSDPDVARTILLRMLDLCSISSNRIRYSLYRALYQLDRLLPHREAVELVRGKILAGRDWKGKSLESLIRAAKHMESWDRTDTEMLLRSDLPASAKALLLN